LVVDADAALLGLLEEWLGNHGHSVVQERADVGLERERFDLVVVDVPFPRQGGLTVLRRIQNEHPRTPILALSSTFFAGVERNGAIARTLGVASVLPMPVTRETLIATVRKLLRQ
jgi:two-component system phosphate regulon response regulator OmpR